MYLCDLQSGKRMLNINHITELLNLIGLSQGLICGLLLVFAAIFKKSPTFLAGLYILSFSFSLIMPVLKDSGITDAYPGLLYFPSFMLFQAPLLYLYAQQIAKGYINKKAYSLLLFGIIEVIVFTLLAFFNSDLSDAFLNGFFPAYIIFTYSFMVFILIVTVKWVSDFQKQITEYHSVGHEKTLSWLKYVSLVLIVFIVEAAISMVFFMEKPIFNTIDIINTALEVVFIYWVTIQALRQSSLFQTKQVQVLEAKHTDFDFSEIKKDIISEEQASELYENLLNLMKDRKPYKNSELTLFELAEVSGIHPKKLSYIINKKAKSNFNHFINKYRIQEAKDLLKNPEYDYLNMQGIASLSGFNSKSTFFTMFKKFTNTTPNVFKKAQLSIS
jgi:AraC-like DNA-binding protein